MYARLIQWALDDRSLYSLWSNKNILNLAGVNNALNDSNRRNNCQNSILQASFTKQIYTLKHFASRAFIGKE